MKGKIPMHKDTPETDAAQEVAGPRGLVDWTLAKRELQAPLSSAAIKPPPKGKFGEYVDGLHVIREANRIFGENGWSYEITRMKQSHSKVFDIGEKRQYRTSFLCTVRVDVDGVIREGAAVGSGMGKEADTSSVIESAVKEAETDALKRALRSFGNTFGLALYEKDKSKREVADMGNATPQHEPKNRGAYVSAVSINGAIDAINKCATVKAIKAEFEKIKAFSAALSEHEDVRAAANSRRNELNKTKTGVIDDDVVKTISELEAIIDADELESYWSTLNANFRQVAGMSLVIAAKDKCKAKIDDAAKKAAIEAAKNNSSTELDDEIPY